MSKVKKPAIKSKRAKASEPVKALAGTEEKVPLSSLLLGIALLLAIMVAGAAWMGGSMPQIENRLTRIFDRSAETFGLTLAQISIDGVQGPTRIRVEAATRLKIGDNMFRASPQRIQNAVDATGLVMNVTVYRLWPNHIRITADPVAPIAIWRQGADWQVIDSLGRVVPGASVKPSDAGLLQIFGPGADISAPSLVHAFERFPDLASRIDRAVRVSARRWDIIFVNGIKVRLPRDENLSEAVSRLAQLQAEDMILDRAISQIDLRHSEQVFLTPNNQDRMGTITGSGE